MDIGYQATYLPTSAPVSTENGKVTPVGLESVMVLASKHDPRDIVGRLTHPLSIETAGLS